MRKKTVLILGLIFVMLKTYSQTVTDVDGHVYNTLTIGTQVWMKQNLKTTRYNDNQPIINITDNLQWGQLNTGAYCDYNNDTNQSNTYGRLYNWMVMDEGKNVCPSGWHVPSHDEWSILERAICSSGTCASDFPFDTIAISWRGTDEGNKLKEAGTTHWASGNAGTNSSNFTSLPGGTRSSLQFSTLGTLAIFWTSTPYANTHAWYRGQANYTTKSTRGHYDKKYGCSIRCIKNSRQEIHGRVRYLNTAATPFDYIKIILQDQSHQKIDSTYTDFSGYYSFTVTTNGTYYVKPIISKLPGGFNSMDALKVLRHFVHLDTLTGLYLTAADVNVSTSINSVDALLIMNRFVGLSNFFLAGDWLYNFEPVVNTGTNQIHDINILTVGDVNASYIPPPCNPAPSVANAGPDQLNITGNTVLLNANSLLAGETGTWSILLGSCGSISNIHDPQAVFSGVAGNSYILRWTIQNLCGKISDDINISFLNAFSCGTDISYAGQTYHTLQLGCQCWMKENLNIGTMISSTSSQTNNSIVEKYCPSGTLANCTTYGGLYQWDELMQYTTTSGARGICPDNFRIPTNEEWCLLARTIDATVNCSSMGYTGGYICGDLKETGTTHWQSPNYAATNATNFTALGSGWRLSDGTFGTSLMRDAYFATSSEASASNEWYWSLDYNLAGINHNNVAKSYGLSVRCVRDSCAYPASLSNPGLGQSVVGNSVTLAANTPSHGTGHWSVISGSGGIFSDAFSPSSIFTGNPGVYTLQWTISTSCSSSSNTVDITFICLPQPTTAAAGPDQVVSGDTTTLGANAAVEGTGLWTIVSGTGGIIADPTSPVSGFTGNYTTYTLAWTISNSCGSSTDQVVVTFNCYPPPSIAYAGANQTIVGSSTTLAANVPVNGTGSWSYVSGPGGYVNDLSNPLSDFSGNYGTHTLQWTITTPCGSSSSQVSISFNCVLQPTIATAGADQVVNGPATVLAGNTAVNGTGQWTIVSGTGGIIADPTSPVSGFTGNYTTYTLAWTISNSCGSSTDQVMITFNCYPPPSIAVAGPNQSIGGSATTLAANAPVNGTGSWTYISGPGGYINDLSDPLSAFSGNYGTHVLQWTITTACGSSSSQVSITFSCVPQPTTANAGPNQSVNGTFTDLAANVPADGNGHWSIVSGTGANISDLTSPVSSFSGSYGTYVLAWTITTACGSSSSQVTITFNCVPQPTPSNAGTNQNVSGTSTTLAGNIATSGTGLWTILSGTGGHMADSTSPTSAFTGSFGTYVLQWTISTLCGSSSSTVTIVFSAVPGSPCPGIATVDYSGKTYNTVQVGGQCWLKENLDVGTQISTSVAPTDNGIIEKNCYNNDPANCLVYGGLYRWDEAMQYTNIGGTQGICPAGWHIPTDADWCTLATYIDYIVVCTYNNNWQGLTVGTKMKEIGTSHWNSPNSGATNNSGFTALGSGDYNGSSMAFENFKVISIFMSSSELNLNTAWSWILGTNYGSINRKSTVKTFSIPVRCLMN